MKSFFFIPSDNEIFLKNKVNLKSNEFIIDFEDSINQENSLIAFNNLDKFSISKETWIRIPNPFSSSNIYSNKIFNDLLLLGYKNFILPKIRNITERDKIFKYVDVNKIAHSKIKFIILVENPIALLNLYEICNSKLVYGIGIGSHDYCAEMNMEHTHENLDYLRSFSLQVAKALQIVIIDFASMNVNLKNEFEFECKDSLSKGFDGKFLIHPWQLKVFKDCIKLSMKDLQFAQKVKSYLDDNGGIENFSIARIDGKIVEKPHLNGILKLLN
jgi:citrate lyase beta subunit